MKKIIVNGANGRMRKEVLKMILEKNELVLVGACDKKNINKKIKDIVNFSNKDEINDEIEDLIISKNLSDLLEKTDVDIVVDFTTPNSVMENIRTTLEKGTNMIVGTTGITESDLEEIKELVEKYNAKIIIAPNFSIGAVLMMQFSQIAADYMDDAEIIELHHDQKIDSPSGTSLRTAELINDNIKNKAKNKKEYLEKIPGVRGGSKENINIHSIRLKGLVAHQEVIFSADGQSLKIKHDSYNRSSFMPGVALAIDKIEDIDGLVYGLEKLI